MYYNRIEDETIDILDEGLTIAANARSLDFKGSGVTATAVDKAVTAQIPGDGWSATNITYDNTTSWLDATNVQDAIDEVYSEENLWDRTGTVLSPHNAGDSLKINTINEETLDNGVDIETVHLENGNISNVGTLNVDTITEKTLNNGVTIEGVLLKDNDVKATSFTIGANTLTSSEFGYLDGQNQAVKTTDTPEFQDVNITGLTGSSVITNTSIETTLENIDEGFINANEWTGITPAEKAKFTIDYNYATQVLTLTKISDWFYYYKGRKVSVTGNIVATAHSNTYGTYYYYFNDSTGAITVSDTAFDISTTAQIAYVLYNPTATDTIKGIAFDERHGLQMDGKTHEYLHETRGAIYESGGAMADYVLNTDTTAATSYSISATTFDDEDLEITTAAQSDGSNYVIMWRTAAGQWDWLTGQSLPYIITSNNITYNPAGSALTQVTTTNRYFNNYTIATNAISTTFQNMVLPSRMLYSTLAEAQAEDFTTYFSRTGFLAEFVPLQKVSIFYNAGLSTTTGKSRIAAVANLRGLVTITGGTPATDHLSLSNLTGGTYGDGGHTLLTQQSINASTAPTVNSDIDSYKEGSHWIKQDDNTIYHCADNADGAAVWYGLNQSLMTTSSPTFLKVNGLSFGANDTDNNTYVGFEAGKNLVAGATRNTYLGYEAGKGGVITNASDNNTGIGYLTLNKITSANNNIAIGSLALQEATSGFYNVSIGSDSMSLNSKGASGNTSIGFQSLKNITTNGNYNIAIGQASMIENTTGSNNTAIGKNSLSNNKTGSSNIAIGYYAGNYETVSNAFYVDSRDRTNTAGDKAGAILYGVMSDTPASQTLTTNSAFTATYGINIPTGQTYKINGSPLSHTQIADIGSNTHAQIDSFISSKGNANGLASLDAGGKVPVTQLPSSIMQYQGTWNANTNTPTLADGTGDAGDVYIVSVAGTQNLGSGTITFEIGDWVIYNGSIWQKSDSSDAVASVFGRTGAVTAQSGDYNTSQVTENTNLYFTNARAIGSTLTGYTATSGTIAATDTILQAIQKLGNDKHVAVTLGANHGLSLTGQVLAMGTPSTITSATTNAVTTTTHSHAITAGLGFIGNGSAANQILVTGTTPFAPTWTTATNLVSLNGLTYAAASFVKMTGANTFTLDTNTYLTGNQTITLSGAVTGSGTTAITTTIATPGTLTVSSTNSTATAHTHAITSAVSPGAAAAILATGSTGHIGATGGRIVKGWFTDLEVTNAIVGSITGTSGVATTVTVADESADTTCFPLFVTAATGNLGAKTAAGLKFNASTDVLSGTFSGNITGNVTGNCSGTAATVTQAAQTAITSLGTLTALQVDNLNINGNTISATTGAINITPVAGSAIVLDGTISIDAGVITGATSITSTTFVGNLTGNASGSSGSCTGNAATATKLATARAIYGNNFDGSAALNQIIASTYGGTGNGFTKFSGPTTAEKTFTLPNANATLLYSGGALGTPSSGTVTNLTGTASININGTVGATTANTGAFTSVLSPKINLNREGVAAVGYNFYNTTINAWQIYMGPGATASQGYNGNLTTTQGTYVTSWAMRSNVEPNAGYGWIWETITSGGTGATTVVAELASATGNFRTIGSIFAASLGATASRITKGWFTDLQTTNAPIIDSLTASRVVCSGASKQLVSATTTTTQVNYLSAATGTTGTTSTNLVFSTSPTLTTPTLSSPRITYDTDVITTNTTLDATYEMVICNSATAFTVTLPAVSGLAGRKYTIKNKNTGIITVDGSGSELIDNNLTVQLLQWESITIVCDGTRWNII